MAGECAGSAAFLLFVQMFKDEHSRGKDLGTTVHVVLEIAGSSKQWAGRMGIVRMSRWCDDSGYLEGDLASGLCSKPYIAH